jgi:hypothetical protein
MVTISDDSGGYQAEGNQKAIEICSVKLKKSKIRGGYTQNFRSCVEK